jgi:hypothetical protein
MRPPVEEGPGTEEIPVKGLPLSHGFLANEDFSIGSHAVSHVSRGLRERDRYRTLFGFKSTETSGYTYDVKHGDHGLHGECGVDSSVSGTRFGKVTLAEHEVRLGCACSDEGGKARVTAVVELPQGENRGTLTAGDHAYTLRVIHDVQGGTSMMDPAGYRVDGDGFIGAVDVLYPGHVWLDKGIEPDERSQLLCAFAGLLLYVPAHD